MAKRTFSREFKRQVAREALSGEKRLAVLVEDHPIDYGSFEGTIPEGNYGAGSVTVWDRGTYELLGEESFEQQMERGDLKFTLHGHKLMGAFALARRIMIS